MSSVHAVPAEFPFPCQFFPASHTPRRCHGLQLWQAFQAYLFSKRPDDSVTDRTSPRKQQLQYCFFHFTYHMYSSWGMQQISLILCSNAVYLRFSLTFSIILRTVSPLPKMVTQFLALVMPVYKRLRLNSILGPPRSGRITAGYSLP